MKYAGYYLAPVLSIIALLAYFSPWYGDAHECLGFYILAFLWFLVAWAAILVHLIFMALCIRKHDKNWRHHLIAVFIVSSSYIGLFIGLVNNYIVTV
jgi:FtsH-binding integral membrane protein